MAAQEPQPDCDGQWRDTAHPHVMRCDGCGTLTCFVETTHGLVAYDFPEGYQAHEAHRAAEQEHLLLVTYGEATP